MMKLTDSDILTLEIYFSNGNNYNIRDILSDFSIKNELIEEEVDKYEFNESIDANYEVEKINIVKDLEEIVSLFGDNPPFRFNADSNELEKNVNIDRKTYSFCLSLAKNGAREITVKEKNYTTDKLGELFEHVVHIALEESRKDYAVKRLVNIHKELKEICEECGIQFHSLERCNQDAKDGGVDLIAYRKTHDKAKRGHIILVQCAAGRNYVRKDKDCNLDHWNKYIGDLYTHTKMLAIPHIYLSRETHELGGQRLGDAGEIFDRICLWQFINDDKLKEKYPDSYKIITTNKWL